MLIILSLLVAALSALTVSARRPLLPSQDPFWQPPENLSDYKPGDVIRHRAVPSQLGIYAGKLNVASAHHILYRTTGARDEPLATVTTVLVPKNADYRKLVSYQAEIDAPYGGCNPSITLQKKYANVNNIASQYNEFWMVSALQRGWIVAWPDYQGPDSSFAVGILEGRMTLDGIRAALRSTKITGIKPDARTVMWGYSGGTIATDFALELQETYAPELKLAGAAMGGLPVSIKHLINNNNNKVGAGLILSGIFGVAHAYPDAREILMEQIKPESLKALRQVEKQCVVPTVIQFLGKDVFTNFKNGSRILEIPRFKELLDSLSMGQIATPKTPMFIYQAINDELLNSDDVQTLVKQYCGKGASIQYLKASYGGHIINALAGAATATQWLKDRLDGKPAQEKCSERTVVSPALDKAAVKTFAKIVADIAIARSGKTLGP
ncbi:hypothetical protein HIM_06748 [Hirsutella minnesotensis 3608]|uniref:Uncharacterized protein n=1 Tax=Hirsutella minnesotensis 3608 TaxID=1043627 RepID=A0A0F7ZNJ4_9HYPO|nr:hypothetical protein HIM_06748 [Hirsutella minnesotensis 3608]